MKKSTKAALISALVFPGAGHIYLKKYLRGIILATLSLTAIASLISYTVERALQIAEKIQSGQIPPDIPAITELLSQQPAGNTLLIQHIAATAIILCWIVGIIDAYRAGGKSIPTRDKAST